MLGLGAGLLGVTRVDLDHAVRLEGKHGLDLIPAEVEDGTIEPGLLRDVDARGTDCAFR